MANYYRAVIDLSHGLVVTLDSRGRILNVNSRLETVSGHRLSELSTLDWFETFVPDEDRIASREAFALALANGETVQRQDRMITRQGEMRFIDWNYRIVLDSRGCTNAVLCVGQDVTVHVRNRRRLQQERFALIEKNKELTCLYGMTRVFETPGTTIEEILGNVVALIPSALSFSPNRPRPASSLTSGAFAPTAFRTPR